MGGALTALVFMVLIYAVPDCQPVRQHEPFDHNNASQTHVSTLLPTSTLSTKSSISRKSTTTVVSASSSSTLAINATKYRRKRSNNDNEVIDLESESRSVESEEQIPKISFGASQLDDWDQLGKRRDSNSTDYDMYGYHGHGFTIQVTPWQLV